VCLSWAYSLDANITCTTVQTKNTFKYYKTRLHVYTRTHIAQYTRTFYTDPSGLVLFTSVSRAPAAQSSPHLHHPTRLRRPSEVVAAVLRWAAGGCKVVAPKATAYLCVRVDDMFESKRQEERCIYVQCILAILHIRTLHACIPGNISPRTTPGDEGRARSRSLLCASPHRRFLQRLIPHKLDPRTTSLGKANESRFGHLTTIIGQAVH